MILLLIANTAHADTSSKAQELMKIMGIEKATFVQLSDDK